MVFVLYWSVTKDKMNEAIRRFEETKGAVPEGVQLLARWHHVGERKGVTIVQSNDAAAVARGALEWNDLMDIEVRQVLDDKEAAGVLFSGR